MKSNFQLINALVVACEFDEVHSVALGVLRVDFYRLEEEARHRFHTVARPIRNSRGQISEEPMTDIRRGKF